MGKVAMVTGAGRGIGRAIAVALAEAGYDIALVARSEPELQGTATLIQRAGQRAWIAPTDVTDPVAIDRVMSAIKDDVAVLVNNAGIAPAYKFLETTDELWHTTLNVNLTGAFYCCRAVLPAMLAAGWGRIINVASTAAKIGYPYNAAYVASKHGLLGLTRSLAMEVAKTGVTVNALCPGFVDTDIVQDATANIMARTGRSEAEARKALEAMSPQGRLMTAEEVAAAAVYLVSDAARGVNGQSIVIDGGGVQA